MLVAHTVPVHHQCWKLWALCIYMASWQQMQVLQNQEEATQCKCFIFIIYSINTKTRKSIDESTEFTAVIKPTPITKKLSGQRPMTMTQWWCGCWKATAGVLLLQIGRGHVQSTPAYLQFSICGFVDFKVICGKFAYLLIFFVEHI